jgi:hypothetical protein
VVPFALIFGVWMALLWHGPTATLSGAPSGDIAFYASSVWSLAARPYPLPDLGLESAAGVPYFNLLFTAYGAALVPIPGFDPFLHILAGGGASYILLSTLMLHIYLADRAPARIDAFACVILLLSFLVAARNPFWVVGSIPMVFVPALTLAVWWMVEQSRANIGWGVAALAAGLLGSSLSKVVAAIVLVPLAGTSFWDWLRSIARRNRLLTFAVGAVFTVYCLFMLATYLPGFLKMAPLGPESRATPYWWAVARDAGAIALMGLAWRIADRPVALVLIGGFASFLAFAWLFHANFVCATLLLGVMAFLRPDKLASSRFLAIAGFGAALPATIMSDPAGLSSGIVWILCLGSSTAIALWTAVSPTTAAYAQGIRVARVGAAGVLVAAAFALIGVARGNIIIESGFPKLPPTVRDIWLAVREHTPFNALVFTDQVADVAEGGTPSLLAGWNTYASIGQRQIYICNYYSLNELRFDKDKRRAVLAVNDAVLTGEKPPADVPTRGRYSRFFAVVSKSHPIPPGWKPVYDNKDYRLFELSPRVASM